MLYRYINPCMCDMEAQGTGRERQRLGMTERKGTN